MDIIDFHTHVFPDSLAPRAIAALRENCLEAINYLDGTLSDLRRSMRRYDIRDSVLLSIATKPEQVETINSSCKALMGDGVIPFGTLHPLHQDNPGQVERLAGMGVRGIKLHPEYQDFYVDDPSLFPAYEALQAAGLIVVLHAGKDPGPFTCDHALPPAILTVIRNFPKLILVAAHMGGWMVWDEVEARLAGKPLFFDTSAALNHLDKGQFIRIVRKHGAENILFGTDSPWYDQGEVISWINGMDLTEREKEQIFSGTAQQLLGTRS